MERGRRLPLMDWRPPTPTMTPSAMAVVAPPAWQRVPFAGQHQQQLWWCWAAVAASVAQSINPGSTWSQCSVATSVLARNCCQNVGPCNVPGQLDSALGTVGHMRKMILGQIGEADLEQEALAQLPVGTRIQWTGGGGHFVAFTGVLRGSQTYIGIEDPWFGSSDVALSALNGAYQGSGTWTTTYLIQ
jgi:hypothetical protein